MSDSPSSQLIFKVAADVTGLDALRKEFNALKGGLEGLLAGIQSATKSAGGASAAEMVRLRSQVTEVTQALATQGKEIESLTSRSEDSARRRATAAERTADTVKRARQTEVDAAAEADRKEQEILFRGAEKQAIANAQLMAKLKLERGAENAADQVKLEEQMGRLRQERAIANANGLLKIEADMQRERTRIAQEEEKKRLAMVEAENAVVLRLMSLGAGKFAAPAGSAGASAANGIKQNTQDMLANALATREAHSAVRGLAGGLGALWTTYGSFVPLIAGFAISASIKKAVDVGTEFQYQMQFVGAVSDATAAQVKAAGDSFKKMSLDSQFGSVQIAEGARTLAQAGFSIEESVKLMPDLLKFATLGEIELARGAEIAAGTMHAFGLSINDIPSILNSTAKAAAISQTTISEMGGALKQASTVGQQFGITVDETNALLAVLAQRNIRGTAAGTSLRNMMQELDPKTAKAKNAFRELGVEVTNSDGTFRKIIPLLQDFATKFSQYDQVSQQRLSNAYFNERGAKAFLNAMKEAGGELPQFLAQIQSAGAGVGYLNEKSALLNETLKVQGKEALNAFSSAAITAFEGVQPELVEALKLVNAYLKSDDFQKGAKDFGTAIGLVSRYLLDHKDTIALVAEGYKAVVNPIGSALDSVSKAFNSMGIEALSTTGLLAKFLHILDMLPGIKVSRDPGVPAVGAGEFGALETGTYSFGVDGESASAKREAERNAKAAKETREQAQTELAQLRRSEAASINSGAAAGDANSKRLRHWNPDAQKEAKDEVSAAQARYKLREQAAKNHIDQLLKLNQSYHAAGLESDEAFIKRESEINAEGFLKETSLEQAYLIKLQNLRSRVDAKEKVKVDQEIERAETEIQKQREARYTKELDDQAKIIGKYVEGGKHEVEAIQKKNDALRSEVAALYSLDPAQKNATVQEIDATVAKLAKEEATLRAAAAVTAYTDVLSEEQSRNLQGADALRKYITQLQAARDENIRLTKDKRAAEDDWLVGANMGLNEYLTTTVSVAKLSKDAITKSFKGMEDAVVNFTKTGKLNLKGFFGSVAEDFLRMAIQMNLTRPLAEAFQGLLQGTSSSGGSFNFSSLLSSVGSAFTSSGGSNGGGGFSGILDAFKTSRPDSGTGLSAGDSLLGGFSYNGNQGLSGAGTGLSGTAQGALLALGASGVSALSQHGPGEMHGGAAVLTGTASGAALGTAIWPGIGTIVGAVVGAIAGSTNKGDARRTALFGNQPGGSGYNYSGGSTFGSFGVYDDHWFSDAEMGTQFKDFLKQMGAFENTLATLLTPDQVATASAALNGSKPYDFGVEHTDFTGTLTEIFQNRATEIVRAVSPTLAQLVANFKGTGQDLQTFVETIVVFSTKIEDLNKTGLDAIDILAGFKEATSDTIISLVNILSYLGGDPIKEAQKQFDDQQKSSYAKWVDSGAAIRELTKTYDGSAAATLRLSDLTKARYQSELELATQIISLHGSTHQTFQDSIRSLRLQTLDNPGKYDFYDKESNDLFNQLKTETDPTKIEGLANKLNDDINAAFNLLDPGQQQSKLQDFIDRLTKVDAQTQARLDAAQAQIEHERNLAFADSVSSAIAAALEKFSKTQEDAANTQLDAANTNATTAQNGLNVHITVDSRGNPTNVEVGGGGRGSDG